VKEPIAEEVQNDFKKPANYGSASLVMQNE
jgi:hypothetical protein